MAHIEAPGAGALVAASPAASPTHSTTPAQAISPSPGAPSINPTGNPVATHLTAGLVTPSLPTAAQVVTSLPHLPVSPGSMVDGVLTAGSINTVAGHVQPTSASAVSGGVSGTEANGSANSMTVLTVGEGDEMRVLTIQATAVQYVLISLHCHSAWSTITHLATFRTVRWYATGELTIQVGDSLDGFTLPSIPRVPNRPALRLTHRRPHRPL